MIAKEKLVKDTYDEEIIYFATLDNFKAFYKGKNLDASEVAFLIGIVCIRHLI